MAALSAAGLLAGIPRSVLLLDWVLAIFFCGGAQVATRLAQRRYLVRRGARRKRVLLIGAGEAGDYLLRQFVSDAQSEFQVVGLVDDDPATRGVSLHGVRVLGDTAALPELAARHRAELLVIAIAAATGEQMRRIVQCCAETRLEYKVIPSLHEIMSGHVRFGELRDVRLEDLLGREPVQLDHELIAQDFGGKVVLITGGAGSIGSELGRQIARFGPARIVLLDQAESPLYYAHLEISQAYPAVDVRPVIADITHLERLEQVFARFRPDYVFHAAAYKHVPMMESNVREAIRNNVKGTLQVVDCAARFGASKFVLISSDKAVNPTSIMGATKRIAERIVRVWPAISGAATDFRVVRFGNVLGSDGSVVPLFQRQLAAGGPLTVTHPDVRRYFMTIPEAVQLVLQAAAHHEASGCIAMLDMGKSMRIADLAEHVIRLSGLVPHRDVQIVFTGLRPGEKLDEELVSTLEATLPTSLDKVFVVQGAEPSPTDTEAGLSRLIDAASYGDEEEITSAILGLVPEYTPPRREVEVALAASGVADRPVAEPGARDRSAAAPIPAPRASVRLADAAAATHLGGSTPR
jgi:FlaA1/EpsC-like NDP-sugar epimerase